MRKHARLRTVPDHPALIRQHVLDARHDPAGAPVLPHVECSLDEEDGQQHNRQCKIGRCRRIAQRLPRDENQDSCKQQDGSEALEEVSQVFAHAMCRWRRGCVLAIALHAAFALVRGEAVFERCVEALHYVLNAECVPLQIRQIYCCLAPISSWIALHQVGWLVGW